MLLICWGGFFKLLQFNNNNKSNNNNNKQAQLLHMTSSKYMRVRYRGFLQIQESVHP